MWDTSNVTNMSKMFSGRGREGRYGRLHNRSRQVNTNAAGLHCADVGPSKGPNFPTGFGQSSGYTFGKPFGSGKDSGKVVIQYKSPGVYQIGLPGGWNKNGKYLQGNGTGPSARSTMPAPVATPTATTSATPAADPHAGHDMSTMSDEQMKGMGHN